MLPENEARDGALYAEVLFSFGGTVLFAFGGPISAAKDAGAKGI